MYCRNQGEWKIDFASRSLWLFYQPGSWLFQALPAVLFKASVHTATGMKRLDAIAEFNADRKVEAVPMGVFQTSVKNCQEEIENGQFVGLRCDLAVFSQTGRPITLSLDHLSLACSRPGCQIYFTRRKILPVAHLHQFVFRPRFPANFQSEDVGKPDPIMDLNYFADTFKVFSTTIKIQYQRSTDSLVQVQSELKVVTDNNENVGMDVAIADFVKFRCLGRCGSAARMPELEQDADVFF
eukprot:TRINITY_DN4970_c0_g2_i4.p1 TRINITY_DN4970_c0_g2~~TRINITY_DN4970_c0_g2_i4.p1  ORF type:complete len:239 (+),score=45.38 TRINITY_DN4970_c0_g2_i4:91-807(+)